MFFGPSDDELRILVQYVFLKYFRNRRKAHLLRVSRWFIRFEMFVLFLESMLCISRIILFFFRIVKRIWQDFKLFFCLVFLFFSKIVFFFAEDVNADVTRNDSTRLTHAWLTLKKTYFQLHVHPNSRLTTEQSYTNVHSVSQKCEQLCPTRRVPRNAHWRVSSTMPSLHTSLQCVLYLSERRSRRRNLVLKFVSHAPHTPPSSAKKRIGFLNPCFIRWWHRSALTDMNCLISSVVPMHSVQVMELDVIVSTCLHLTQDGHCIFV